MAGGQCSQCRFNRQNIGAGGQSFAINEDEGSATDDDCGAWEIIVHGWPKPPWLLDSSPTSPEERIAKRLWAVESLLMLMLLNQHC